MAINLSPQAWDWASITRGDTYPACNLTATGTDTNLARARIKIRNADGGLLLTLDSNTSGITINTATAGAWDYTIDAISSATTSSLPVGIHLYDLEVTGANGVVSTHFKGYWEILAQITD